MVMTEGNLHYGRLTAWRIRAYQGGEQTKPRFVHEHHRLPRRCRLLEQGRPFDFAPALDSRFVSLISSVAWLLARPFDFLENARDVIRMILYPIFSWITVAIRA